MPKIEAHEEVAIRNQIVLDCLLENNNTSPSEFAPWAVTVAFYKALHLVEGIFYIDGLQHEKRPFHSKDHKERNQRLKSIKKFGHIWKHYRPLFAVSMIARYLFDPDTGTDQIDLDAYLPGNSVRSTFINHHLRQIEKSFESKKADFASSENFCSNS
jgi:hypothetical protein